MSRRAIVCAMLVVTVLTGVSVHGQQPGAAPKPALVPLDVEVVLSRYQGDKKVSSIPYILNVNANGDQTKLSMGTEVPVAATAFTPAGQGGQQPAPLRSYNYRTVGINIELRATSVNDNLFQLQLNVEDSSVFTPDARQPSVPVMPDMPAFRSFRGTNSVLLKDGQTRQYTVATDRVTGDVLKVDVSLKVLKN
jgi:hypothetical protein